MTTEATPLTNEPTAHYPIRIQPLTTLRVTNLIGALIIAASGLFGVWGGFALGLTSPEGWVLLAISAPFALYGLAVLPGTQRLQIVLHPDRAIVRGYFGSREIPRPSIRGITDYPSIVWTDQRGRIRSTPINALNIYRSGRAAPNPELVAANDRKVALVASWAMNPTTGASKQW